jgi:hypothetical protein
MRNLRTSGAVGLLLSQLALFQSACSASGSSAKTPEGAIQRDTAIVHEECDIDAGGATKLDANGDKRPDVVIVKDGGREVCRALDLNFDGGMDSWIYYGADGQVRRRESDYDRDGRVDEIMVFRAGSIAEKHRATMLTGKLDTWEFYQAGALARTERDSNGDSLVDQWWEYPRPGCPVIHADVNSDGRPDPGASVDYCKETGYVPPERQDFRKTESPTFEQSGALPTEVENKEEKSPTPGETPQKKEGEK